jgi:membrane protein implicated in regulation of membrane protease activity
MRRWVYLPIEILTSALFSVSIGIAAGVVAISFTHRLGDGPIFALPALLIASLCFGFVLWRAYRPQRQRTLSAGSQKRAAQLASA